MVVKNKTTEKTNKKPSKKGAKYALQVVPGNPPKYDLIKESQDLLNWSLQDDALSLYDFTDKKDYCASELSYFSNNNAVFSKALKKAKERIGNRREKHCNQETMNYGVWARAAAMYSTLLDEFEEAKEDKSLDRKKQAIDYELKKKAEMDTLRGMPPNDSNLTSLINEVKSLKDKINATKPKADPEF